MRNTITIFAVFTGIVLAAPTWGVEWDLSVGYTADHASNTVRTSDDEIDEWIHKPRFRVGAVHDGPNLELDADYDFERRLYEEDIFDDENVTTGRAELLWHALPERLDFVIRNSRTESAQRSIEAVTQDNRQVTSTTEAGPTLRFRAGGGNEFQLSYLYGEVNADETRTDSTRHTSTARYIMASSSTRSLTISALNGQVDFDSTTAPDLDSWTGLVTYSQTGSNNELTLTGGYTSIGRSMGRDDVDGLIFDLDLTFQAGVNTNIAISANQHIGDQASALSQGTADFGDSIDVNSDINEVFTETNAEVSLTQTVGRTQIQLRAFTSNEDYEDVARDNTHNGIGLNLDRALSPLTSLSANIELGNGDFDDQNEEFDELRGNILLTWRAGRRLTVTLGATYEERNADTLSTRDYEEWIASIGVSYAILGSR